MNTFPFKTILLVIVSAILVSNIDALASAKYKGYFVTKDGKTQIVGEFKNIKEEAKYKYNGNEVKISPSDIKSITVVGQNEVVLEKKNGKKFKLKGTIYHLWSLDDGNHNYTYYDEINEKYSTSGVYWEKLSKIVFDDDFGQLRRCPNDGKTFPPDYMFCPFDKTPLELINIQAQSSVNTKSSQAKVASSNLKRSVHTNLNESNARPDSDVNTSVEYVKNSLNPLASQESYSNSLEQLAQEATNQ